MIRNDRLVSHRRVGATAWSEGHLELLGFDQADVGSGSFHSMGGVGVRKLGLLPHHGGETKLRGFRISATAQPVHKVPIHVNTRQAPRFSRRDSEYIGGTKPGAGRSTAYFAVYSTSRCYRSRSG